MTETAITYNVPRGTALITYQQIVVYATSFVYYVLLIRVLNLSQIGEVSLLAAVLSIFATLTQLSLPVAATRFMSASIGGRNLTEAGGVARTTLRLTILLAGLGLLVAFLVSPWVGATVFKTPDSTNLLVVTFAASFLLDLTTLYGAYFLGLGLYAEMVYQNILYVPLSRGLGLVLAYRGLGTLGIPLGWALGGLATLVFSLYLWKGKLSLSTSYPVRPLLAFSLPLFAATLISLLQNWGDITLLQGILGQFGTTGAYYIVVSSVAFLSILWTPIAGALYPSLSSSYHNQGPEAVSEKLATATRLINLTVLPTGAALAAIAPTALELVYGNTLGNQALPFAILSITIIFTAQSLLITTTLQAIGKTRQILWIGLTATIIDLGTVWFGAPVLGTTAGAIGRTLLALTTMLLAWVALRKNLQAFLAHGLPKALTLGTVSALPLFLIDTALTNTLHYAPLPRILLLVPIFFASYLAASRALSVFTPVDFDLMENALPKFLVGALRALERLVLPKTAS